MAYTKSINNKNVPNCVKQLVVIRKHHGYSQQDVADMVGVSKSSISKIETGSRTPSLLMLIAIAKACSGGDAEVSIVNWM